MIYTDFYRIVVGAKWAERWYLGAPIDVGGCEIDPRQFTQGIRVSAAGPYHVNIRKQGYEVDFNFADFDMVVATRQVSSLISEFSQGGIQLIDACIESSKGAHFDIINACTLVDCIDEKKSHFVKWNESDGRPEKVGQYRMITKLAIDGLRAQGHHFFRVAGWPIALVVSRDLKSALEALDVSGISFVQI